MAEVHQWDASAKKNHFQLTSYKYDWKKNQQFEIFGGKGPASRRHPVRDSGRHRDLTETQPPNALQQTHPSSQDKSHPCLHQWWQPTQQPARIALTVRTEEQFICYTARLAQQHTAGSNIRTARHVVPAVLFMGNNFQLKVFEYKIGEIQRQHHLTFQVVAEP